MVLTPTYHAFKMYVPFQDSTFIPSSFESMPEYSLGDVSVPQVSASTAMSKEGDLILALVNLDPHEKAQITATVVGFAAQSATGSVLTADAMDAHNTFDEPETVKTAPISVNVQGGQVQLELPAKSVVVLTIED